MQSIIIQNLSKVCFNCNNSTKYMKKEIDQSKSIFNLIFKCIYYEKGCQEKVNGSQLIAHQEICPFQPFHCPNEGCNYANLLLKDKLNHEETCLLQPIQCTECKTPILRNEIKSHIVNECLANNSSCVECKKQIMIKNCGKHYEDSHKKEERCEKCLGLITLNHDCIVEMTKLLLSSKRKSSFELQEAHEKNEALRIELESIKQYFEEYKASVENKLSNLTISLNSNIQNLTNIINNLHKELKEVYQDKQSISIKLDQALLERKSRTAFEEKLNEEIDKSNKNLNAKIEELNKEIHENLNEKILLCNSEIEKKSEINMKLTNKIKEKLDIQENKIKELYQDLERFKGSTAQDFYQKIESVENESINKLNQINDNSKQVTEVIGKIRDIFDPLSETNIKRLKQNIKTICTFKYIDEEYYSTPEEKERNKFLFYVERKMEHEIDYLHVRNLEQSNDFKVELYKNYNYLNDAVYHNGFIFYCGGGIGNHNFLDLCAFVNIENKTLDLSTRLNEKKCFVSLVSTPDSVYCIGGYNGTALNSCEMFTLKDKNKKWSNIARLNKIQDRITSFFHHPSTIFTLGSTDQDVIEKLEIGSEFLIWETLKIKCPMRAYGCAFAISNKKVLLFGGDSQNQEFYIFNPLKSTLKMKKERFTESTHFNSSKPIYYKGCIIVISESEKQKFIISPEDCKFEVQPIGF